MRLNLQPRCEPILDLLTLPFLPQTVDSNLCTLLDSEFGMHELTDHVDSLTIDSIIQIVSVDKTETGPFKVAPLAQLAFLRF